MSAEGGPPSEEEMRAPLQEELRRVKVDQVVVEAAVSVLNVAVLRSGLVPGAEEERDLEQVRVGIEAVRGFSLSSSRSRRSRRGRSGMRCRSCRWRTFARPAPIPRSRPRPLSSRRERGSRDPGRRRAAGGCGCRASDSADLLVCGTSRSAEFLVAREALRDVLAKSPV